MSQNETYNHIWKYVPKKLELNYVADIKNNWCIADEM
jgi:hypothetical protein